MDTDVRVRCEGVWKRFRKGRRDFREFFANPLRRLFGRSGAERADKYFWALRDLSFELASGRSLGLIGPNGAGKSTTLKLLSRVLRADRGRIVTHGRVGALIELGAGFHPELTGRENIFLAGSILGMKRRRIVDEFDRIVEFSGVGEFIDMPVKRYSSGMFVRLGYAVAARMKPDVLLVDEVLAVGDLAFQAQCFKHMNHLKRSGTAIVFVSHNLNAVSQICDRVILIDWGALQAEGEPEAVFESYLRLVANRQRELMSAPEGDASQGAVTVSEVRLLDAEGRRADEFRSGEHFRAELDLRSREPLGEVCLDLAFHGFDERLQTTCNTRLDEMLLRWDGTETTVKIEMDHLGLPPGSYWIGFAVCDAHSNPVHYWNRKLLHFVVAGRRRNQGQYHQPHTWTFTGALEREARKD